MRISGLAKYQQRHPKGVYFAELPRDQRALAFQHLKRFLLKWRALGGGLPRGRLGILVGQAMRLARMSDADLSAWGKRMLAKRGGYAVQRRYRAEGRHPTEKATRVRQARRQRQKDGSHVSRPANAAVAANDDRREWRTPGACGRPGGPVMTVKVGYGPKPQRA